MPRAHKIQIKAWEEEHKVPMPPTDLPFNDYNKYLLVTMTDGRDKACLWLQWRASVRGSFLPVETTGMSEAVQIWPHPSLDIALSTAGPATRVCYEVVSIGHPPPLPPLEGRAGLKGTSSHSTDGTSPSQHSAAGPDGEGAL